MVSNIFRCETCEDTTCWLCKGNVYYDRVMASKSCDAKSHKSDIGLFRDFIKSKGCASHTNSKLNDKLLKEISEHVDARLDGLENLFKTPANERTESAQDEYLKQAHFELSLIKNIIDHTGDKL